MEKKKLFEYPLNIQLFADGEDGGENGGANKGTPKTYTEEEYNKLKASFDNTSSELAKYKKEAKAKLSEEEKKQKEQEEKDTLLKELQEKVLKSEMTTELTKSGLEENSISNIIEAFKTGDGTNLSKVIAEEILKHIKKVKDEAQKDFQSNGTTPPVGNGKKTDSFIQELLNKKKNTTTQNARDYYLGKK